MREGTHAKDAIMYPEKPKRDDSPNRRVTLDFVSPSPIDGCITLLKRQAYDVWGDRIRLHVDSITPDEWVIQMFEPPKQYGQVMLVEGRLISEESGGTRVLLRDLTGDAGSVLLVLVAGTVAVLGLIGAGTTYYTGLLMFIAGVAGMIWVGVFYKEPKTRGERILNDIEQLLRA